MARNLICGTLLLVAIGWTVAPAQPQLDEGEGEMAVSRFHSLEGIPTTAGFEIPLTQRMPSTRILRLQSQEYYGNPILTNRPRWHSTIPSEAGEPVDADALAKQLIELARVSSWDGHLVNKTGISWEATPDEHETLAWLLDQVRAYYAQRVRFAVFELRDTVQSGTVSAERAAALRGDASLLATRSAHSREIAVISTLRSFDYVGDYALNVATSAAIPNPVTCTMHIGREMALSACPAPDGSLLVRAVRGRSTLQRMRAFDGHTESGIIELPDFTWTIEEGAARLRNGESWVFGDRYLITASISKPYTGARHASKRIAALSPDLLVRRLCTEGFEMPGATPQGAVYGSEYHERQTDGPIEKREHLGHDESASEFLLANIYHELAATGARLRTLGPLICLTWDEETPAPNDVEPPAPSEVRLRVRQWKLARDHPFPDALLDGAPASETLGRLGNPSYDRNLSQFESGRIEDSQLALSNYLASYDTNVATAVDIHDPVVRSLVTGTSLSLELGDDGSAGVPVSVLFGMAPPGEIKSSQAEVPERAKLERATVSATAVRLAGTLRVGESISAITPMPDNPNLLIVLAVTRIEP